MGYGTVYDFIGVKDGNLVLNKQAMRLLAIEEPIYCVAPHGSARGGKSFAMTALAHHLHSVTPLERLTALEATSPPEKFTTSDSYLPQTMGAQAMLVPHPHKGTVVVLDVEGEDLGNAKLHAQLHSIILAISSNCIFFVNGVLDTYALGSIGLLQTRVNELFGTLAGDRTWPRVSILVNKMTNALPDNPNSLLERLLTPTGDCHDPVREEFRGRFPEAACLCIPVSRVESAQKREQGLLTAIRSEENAMTDSDFVSSAKQFCTAISALLKPKFIGGHQASLEEFYELTEASVTAAREGSGMNYGSVVENLQRRMCQIQMEDMFCEFCGKFPPAGITGMPATVTGIDEAVAKGLEDYDSATTAYEATEVRAEVRNQLEKQLVGQKASLMAIHTALLRAQQVKEAQTRLKAANSAASAARVAAADALATIREQKAKIKAMDAQAKASLAEAERARAAAAAAEEEARRRRRRRRRC